MLLKKIMISVFLTAVFILGGCSTADISSDNSTASSTGSVQGTPQSSPPELSSAPVSSSDSFTDSNTENCGNSLSNISNYALAVQSHDTVYYANYSDSGNIYRFSGSDPEAAHKILTGDCTYLSVYNNKLYFIDSEKGDMLFTSELDGSDQQSICNRAVKNFIICNDKIIYTEISAENYDLKYMNPDGTGVNVLAPNFNSTAVIAANDSIYCLVNGNVIRLSFRGGSQTPIYSTGTANCISVSGNMLFINDSAADNGTIKMAELTDEGVSEFKSINRAAASAFNISGEWIYYTDKNDSNSIYKCRLDGSEVTKLSESKNCRYLNVVKEWIFYVEETETGSLHKMMRTDGSMSAEVYSEPLTGNGWN